MTYDPAVIGAVAIGAVILILCAIYIDDNEERRDARQRNHAHRRRWYE